MPSLLLISPIFSDYYHWMCCRKLSRRTQEVWKAPDSIIQVKNPRSLPKTLTPTLTLTSTLYEIYGGLTKSLTWTSKQIEQRMGFGVLSGAMKESAARRELTTKPRTGRDEVTK